MTFVAPLKLVPVMVTAVPATPKMGEKELRTGAIPKLRALVAVPPTVDTVTFPDVAVDGTYAVIVVGDNTRKR